MIGYESSERLDYLPATLKVVETRREKCACSKCQGQLTTVPAKPEIIEGASRCRVFWRIC
ncbi:IS66 family transposase zinc-finger binding domain-containing protein [Methylococcus sp. Mc7]|nr:IS66 family transposase zinc-finger binding domain-containing protein [Methylococcus sp. Mc7]QXP85196.1 IS66 family transposase zinc-finger binding domain-containing protein [Methylococcus sp. Mc7]